MLNRVCACSCLLTWCAPSVDQLDIISWIRIIRRIPSELPWFQFSLISNTQHNSLGEAGSPDTVPDWLTARASLVRQVILISCISTCLGLQFAYSVFPMSQLIYVRYFSRATLYSGAVCLEKVQLPKEEHSASPVIVVFFGVHTIRCISALRS